MAFQVADRVKETTTTTGTSTIDLAGAVEGYQTFVAGIGNGNETYYSISNRDADEWEVGIGTVTDAATDTLSRDTIISSSNGGSAVNFSAGTKDVICTLPADRSFVIDDEANVSVTANVTATSFDGSGAALTALNASNLASGTLPDARFPATLPASSGANLTNLNASNVSSGTLDDARLTANVTLNNASTISAGTLADARLTANVTLNNASTISTGTLAQARLANDSITINGTGVALGGSINVGDITGVTAGDGLTGGGTTGAVTLNVGAGTGIDVSADAVAVDVSDFMTNGSNNRVVTATGTDAMNAEANMTFDGSVLSVTGNVNASSTFNGSGAGLTTLNASNVSSGTLPNARLSAVPNSALDNSSITINGTGVSLGGSINVGDITGVTAGDGLTGGGTTGAVTLNVGAGTLIDVAADTVSVDLSELTTSTSDADGDFFCVVDSANAQKKLTKGNINISGFNNDAGYTTNVGDITGVTAGNGLTGGGASGSVTLNVGAGTGIDVSADAIAVDVSDFMSNGSNNRVLTATGTDAMNAEANMTFDGSTLAVTGGATFTANVSLSDNDYLRLGTSQDLLIYHDGSNSIIKDNGTGNLRLQSTNSIQIGDENMAETFAIFNDDSDVKLYHNNSEKFATTATGISVTGTVVESSSLAYKENVQPLEFNEAIYNVNAVKYDRKDGSAKDEVGVIAEELYKVLPDLVTTKDGKPEAVKYTKMTMYLLEALKKQNKEIQLLKEKLNG